MKRTYAKVLDQTEFLREVLCIPIRVERNEQGIRFESLDGAISYTAGLTPSEAWFFLHGITTAISIQKMYGNRQITP